MDITLSDEQNKVLKEIVAWSKQAVGAPYILGGYAGTGKTTLMKELIKELRGHVVCATPTGKAADVLTEKLDGFPVSTIHSLMYVPTKTNKQMERLSAAEKALEEKPDVKARQNEYRIALKEYEELKWTRKEDVSLSAGDILIIDEASMVEMYHIDNMLAEGVRLVLVGDMFQLPPIRGDNIFASNKPNFVLSTIHRQALDSEIIRLSLYLREQRREPGIGTGKETALVRDKRDYKQSDFIEYDQILVGRNDVRQAINVGQRFLIGHYKPDDISTVYPQEGDKLICTRNVKSWRGGYSVINGEQFTAMETWEESGDDDHLISLVLDQRGNRKAVNAYRHTFELAYGVKNDEQRKVENGDYVFEYGYAVTVHKAQGSEWDRVLLADDGRFGFENRLRWLYTAVTRAKEELLWLK